jgi:MoaA/NifB/PqqE/SkfB family radical SAM enzyme/DNA-binding transcriptional ArsR family regulator
MDLSVLQEALRLGDEELALLVGFLCFREEPRGRLGDLARMEPAQVDVALPRLLEAGLVEAVPRGAQDWYRLLDVPEIARRARAAVPADAPARPALDLELERLAEVRELERRRFINVIGIRERLRAPAAIPSVAEYMRRFYPYLDLRMGTVCNFNCVYCLVGSEKKFVRPVAEIEEDLALGRRAGLLGVALTGGEPTLHPGLFDVLARCRSHGYERIILVTNGSLLAEARNVDRLLEAGVTTFGISYDTADAATANRLWRREAFAAVEAGLGNVLDRPEIPLGTIGVITRATMHQLEDLVRRLDTLTRGRGGLYYFNLDFVMPEENAWEHRDALVPDYREVAPHLTAALDLAAELGLPLTYRGVPPCVAGEAHQDRDMDRFMSIFQIHEDDAGVRYNRAALDLYRTKPRSCRTCKHFRTCPGVYRSYLHLRGPDALVPVPRGRRDG